MPTPTNKFIEINFELKDDNGTIIDSSYGNETFTFITGYNTVIKGLEDAIENMNVGEKKNIVIEAENAYGEVDESAFQTVKMNQFPAGTDIQVGDEFVANANDDLQMPFVVKEINGDDVVLDFNHPLAGKRLHFEVELLQSREATEDELKEYEEEESEEEEE